MEKIILKQREAIILFFLFILIFVLISGLAIYSSKIEIESNSEIQVYNSENKYNATHIVEIENKELNNIISTETQALTTDLYKGQLYENAKNVNNKTLCVYL